MIYPLVFLCITLTVLTWWLKSARLMPLNIGTFLVWWGLILYLYVVMVPPLDITRLAYQFLFGGLMLVSFIPLLLQIISSTYYEKRARHLKGKGGLFGEEAEWGERITYPWSKKHVPTARERQTAYRERLRGGRR